MTRPKDWTKAQDELLKALSAAGVSNLEIGCRLGKSAWVVQGRAEMLGAEAQGTRTVEELRAFWRPLLPGIAAAAVAESRLCTVPEIVE